jgi:YteA family regulatory protein
MDSKYEGLRQKLIKEKADLEIRLKENENFQLNRSMRDSDGELSHVDNHPADTATKMYEREKDVALLEHEKNHLEDIEDALQRMTEGEDYGICKRCGKEIAFERMEAMPTAEYCIEHQIVPKYTSERPVEEDVLTGFGQFNFDRKDDETEFDAEDSWQAVARYNELQGVNYEDVDADEPRGYVEPIEGFIITDMEGNVIEENRDFTRNGVYEDYLNNGEGYGVIWENEIVMPDEDEFND